MYSTRLSIWEELSSCVLEGDSQCLPYDSMEHHDSPVPTHLLQPTHSHSSPLIPTPALSYPLWPSHTHSGPLIATPAVCNPLQPSHTHSNPLHTSFNPLIPTLALSDPFQPSPHPLQPSLTHSSPLLPTPPLSYLTPLLIDSELRTVMILFWITSNDIN
ncbi:hypothetical protein Pcinc_037111 [Petrolisthes cinctipes]|uniref:Uncharacterized protein n=1 Tax=Petrolisthes cinctipes TaxID=88211 RepID=A0AAE1BWL8_PETCI|nr:hypothetical protein Pcinc_037111 [Petrolisthes cinctipes]